MTFGCGSKSLYPSIIPRASTFTLKAEPYAIPGGNLSVRERLANGFADLFCDLGKGVFLRHVKRVHLFVPGLATISLISRLATEAFETSVLQHAYLILRFSRH